MASNSIHNLVFAKAAHATYKSTPKTNKVSYPHKSLVGLGEVR